MVNYTLKQKIIKFLIENKDSKHSIREISQKLKADYKNTSQALSKINPRTHSKIKQGNSYIIDFSPDNNIEILSVEKKRTEDFFSKNLKLKVLKKYIQELNYPFLVVLAFGSYIKRTNTKNSDIDICIILDNKAKSIELNEKLNLLSLNLEIQEFTSKEFVSMIEKKQNNLGNEIVKNNIILYGTENYYNLISI